MTYSYDNISLLRDGKRWFPVMGEIHYSRFPSEYWKEAILKMKSGGVDVISSYVIWIHHEEEEGEWDFTGVRNLRAFVETVKECGLTMFLRVGPWVHAEVRNGGFPDWLCSRFGNKVRTNNEGYFSCVKKFYEKIYEEVKGLFVKDGGPIIGIQVENEYGHCGGLTGAEGEEHMKRLTSMLKETGFDVPYWTATGWGGAVTAGLLPVMGGYCDAPWDPRPAEIEPSGNFVFTYERNDHAIGSDYGLGEGITFDMSKVPYLTAELGGGLQVTYKRRPVAKAKDIVAMSISKMGSGCNLLGYYMYHGGFNPEGKLSTLQETQSTGSFCELPVKSYDFRAPLGENGTPYESYFFMRELFNFVHLHGSELCGMETFIPKENPSTPENFKDLRYSIRWNKEEERGFLFINNYQRRNEMLDHYGASIKIKDTAFNIDVKNGEYAIYSFNLREKNPLLKKEFPLYEKSVQFNGVKFTSSSLLYADKNLIYIEDRNSPFFTACPQLHNIPAGFKCTSLNTQKNEASYEYTASLPLAPGFSHKVLSATEEKFTMSIHVEPWQEDHFGTMHDVFLRIQYVGNGARLYLKDKLVMDNVYLGLDENNRNYWWEVSLRRFGKEALDFILEVDALKKDAPCYIENWPDFEDKKSLCYVQNVDVSRSVRIEFKI